MTRQIKKKVETTDGKPDEWTADEELMVNKAASKVRRKQNMFESTLSPLVRRQNIVVGRQWQRPPIVFMQHFPLPGRSSLPVRRATAGRRSPSMSRPMPTPTGSERRR